MEARLILTIIKLKFHKLNVKIKFCVKTHFPTLETATPQTYFIKQREHIIVTVQPRVNDTSGM